MRRGRIAGIVLAVGLLSPPVAAIDIDLGAEELEAILASAAPVRIPVQVAGFIENLRCGDPRDLTLSAATIRFRATCTGSPVPLRAEVEPEIRFSRDPESGALRGTLSRMPLRIAFIGSVDLADYLPDIEIPGVIRRRVDFQDGPRTIEIRIHALRIQPDGVSVRFDLRFGPPGAEAGGAPAGP